MDQAFDIQQFIADLRSGEFRLFSHNELADYLEMRLGLAA